MSGFLSKVKRGAGKVAFEADKVADVKRLQFDIMQLRRQMESLYTRVGEMAHHRYISKGQDSPEFIEECEKILRLEQQIGEKEEEIKRVNARTYQPQVEAPPAPAPYTPEVQQPAAVAQVTPTPYTLEAQVQQPSTTQVAPPISTQQVKFCTNCGKPLEALSRFCPECGVKTG
jgi:hypothetical protein